MFVRSSGSLSSVFGASFGKRMIFLSSVSGLSLAFGSFRSLLSDFVTQKELMRPEVVFLKDCLALAPPPLEVVTLLPAPCLGPFFVAIISSTLDVDLEGAFGSNFEIEGRRGSHGKIWPADGLEDGLAKPNSTSEEPSSFMVALSFKLRWELEHKDGGG